MYVLCNGFGRLRQKPFGRRNCKPIYFIAKTFRQENLTRRLYGNGRAFTQLRRSHKISQIGLSYRHITISTVGLVPQIKKLAKENLPIHLAISLHSPLDAVRSQLIPANKRWGIAELLDACREFTRTTGRKLTFEYLLIEKVTDTPEQAEKLAKLLKGLPCLVNLIPFNYVVTGQNYKRPSTARVSAFRNILESKGMNVTQRVERGHKISAACGQLKGLHDGKYAKRRSSLELSLLQSH
jgi:23S rRNA (adenine2503-C2)-methyltransferase